MMTHAGYGTDVLNLVVFEYFNFKYVKFDPRTRISLKSIDGSGVKNCRRTFHCIFSNYCKINLI
jgi:hypothetical protein